MTRCRCRGARGCPCRSAPRWCPAHRPQRRLGRDLAPPGSRSDPRQSAAGTAPRLRSGADPALSGLLRPRRAVVSAPRTARAAHRRRLHVPAAPLSAPGGANQRSMACSRCGCTAVQRLSVPCRCPLRAASSCMSAAAQPGSRLAARHQRRSAPRGACAGVSRPAGGPR